MRDAIPTELLLRLMNATPEQYAAVEKILAASVVAIPASLSEDVARNAFALLQKLEVDATVKQPSALTVFRLYCVEGLSADAVARKCRCSKGTVINRLRVIETRTGMKAEQFRAMSDRFAQMENEFADSGAVKIYRRGLAQENESE